MYVYMHTRKALRKISNWFSGGKKVARKWNVPAFCWNPDPGTTHCGNVSIQ